MYGWLVTTRAGKTRKIKYTNKDQIDAFWPLSVGNKAQWTAKANGRKYEFKAEVASFEKVRVPAGEFDTFLIKYHEYNRPTKNTVEKEYWYAPSLGAHVKVKTRSERPGADRRKSEMVLLGCSHEAREFSSKIISKSKEYQACQTAKGDGSKTAKFMQSLTQSQLTKFLNKNQSCDAF